MPRAFRPGRDGLPFPIVPRLALLLLSLVFVLHPLESTPSDSMEPKDSNASGQRETTADAATLRHEELDRQLLELRQRLRAFSFSCYGSASKLVGPDSLRVQCAIPSRFSGDGDSTLWNGLLCFTGRNPWACEAVRSSQTNDGRMWRSSRRAKTRNDGDDYPQASFSRDMARGVLLYLLKTRDVELGNRWSEYINSAGALCPDHFDYSCDIRGQSYRRINHVLDTLDATRISFTHTVFPCLWPVYPLSSALHETMMEKRVQENQSFHLHLAAIDLLMDPHMKKPLYDEQTRKAMAQTLFERKPYNLFYQYLAEGPTTDLKERILRLAPTRRPPFLSQWVWEREIPDRDLKKFGLTSGPGQDPEKLEKAFKAFVDLESMGWDFVFIIDLVVGQRPDPT